MIENFQAEVGARIRDFQNAMREVDRQIRETALGADAEIGADMTEFLSEMEVVNILLTDIAQGADADIGAEMTEFLTEIELANILLADLAQSADVDIGIDMTEFMTELSLVNILLTDLVQDNDIDIDIDADIDDFIVDTEIVRRTLREFLRDRIVIPVEARVNKFSQTLGRIASFTRSFQELQQTTARGFGLALSPALVPLLSSLGGLIGQLGPMVGVLAGSTFALGSAFATAGIGAAGFGTIAIANLKDVFTASSELKDLQAKLDDATTLKERTKILNEMKSVQGSLNDEQTKALESMSKLKGIWTGITDGLESQTLQIFTKSLNIFGTILEKMTPMFQTVTVSANRLSATFGRAIDSDNLTAIFEYLNKSAAPLMEDIVKSAGNFIQGILSMFVAFGPLTEATSKGFLAMSESFADWAAGLGESKKFQSFVDYVNENMPKIRSIFGDAFEGIINVFAGFAPSSADMMTSLEDMMERFKEWSSTISENQGFQKFIDYIKENGPTVIATIGSVVSAIVNVGIALAPVGSWLLGVVNSFITWTNSMMENYPILGKIGAAVLVMTGLLIAIAPNIIAFGTLFGGAATAIWTATSLMRAQFVTGMQMMIASMFSAAKQMVITAAQFVAKWVVIGAQSLVQAARVAAAWVLATGQKMATAIAGMATAAAKFVAKWVLIGAQALIHAAKVAAGWALSTGAAMATAVGKMIATSTVFVAKWVWMGAQALLQAARMAAAWFIALGPIGWVTAAVVALVVLVIANWDKIKSKTIEIWNKVSNAVKEAWEKAKEKTIEGIAKLIGKISEIAGKVLEFKSEMLSAGKDLIQGLIDGAVGMAKDAIDAVKEIAGDMVDAALSFFKIKSPSRVFKEIGNFVGLGLAIGVSETERENANAMSSLGKEVQNIATADAKKMTDLQMATAKKSREIAEKASRDISDIQKKAASPSAISTDIGMHIGQSLIEGMRSMTRKVMQASQQLALAAVPERADIATGDYSLKAIDKGLQRQISRDMDMNFKVDHLNASGVGSESQARVINHNYVSINAKDVKDINDVVKIFDPIQKNRLGNHAGRIGQLI